MMIRPATQDDVPAVVAMCATFAADFPIFGPILAFDAQKVQAVTEGLVASPTGVVLVAEREGALVGMAAAHTFAHPMASTTVANEVVWWVDPAHRGGVGMRLMEALEGWAREQGAEVMVMVSPSPAVDALYEKCDYTRAETSYLRRL